ncbi:MAG: type II toxin-antitoxin system VapC family toxin [Caulobacteraceae bacterium]
MTLVIDASVAVKWVVKEEGSDLAAAYTEGDFVVPEIWLAEAANALWRKVLRTELSRTEAMAALGVLLEVEPGYISHAELADRALRIAVTLNHPIYDCLYLACAEREDCELITADARFVTAAGKHPDFADRVRLLGV